MVAFLDDYGERSESHNQIRAGYLHQPQQDIAPHKNVMSRNEIIRRNGGCNGHRTHQRVMRGRSSGLRNRQVIAIKVISTSDPTDPQKERSMSKVSIAIAAALIAGVSPVAAHAQTSGYVGPPRELHTQSKRLKARLPSNVNASDSGGFPTPALAVGGRWFKTDPVPRVRFKMKEIARHAHPAPLADEGRRIPIDDCVHAVFPACDGGP
jgi:hypothetical protein